MTEEQITQQIMAHGKDIAALWESTKSAHKRIDENDRVTEGIHDLSASIAGMTAEMKGIAERMEEGNDRMTASIETITAGQRAQGERIGALERALVGLAKLPEAIDKLSAKVDTIEKEPATKWKALVSQVVAIVVAGLVGGVLARLIG